MRLPNWLVRYLVRTQSTEKISSQHNDEFVTSVQHLAVIMDGNGRWAKQRGLARTEGHRQGLERVREIITSCNDLGIQYLTLYAFSTENWKRPNEEVSFLMNLFKQVLKDDVLELMEKSVRLKFLGFRHNLDSELQLQMAESEKLTSTGSGLQLNLAINYGGRGEIISAVQSLAREVKNGRLEPEAIDDAILSERLFTAGIPDPDLLIRPSGELRISNFLLWQSAYTEFYFTPVLWPDFKREALLEALSDYERRKRRFGNV